MANSQGYIEEELKKAGYRAEYSGFPQAGPAINEAFSGNSIDVAQYSEFPALTLRSKGVGIHAFAVADAAQAFGIVVPGDSGAQSVEDLKGKTVAVGIGTVAQRYLVLALGKAGLAVGDVQLVNADSSHGPSMIATKSVDAWATLYQLAFTSAGKTDGRIIASSLDDPSLSTTSNLFARDDFAKDNRPALVALARALRRGYEYARQNPDEARRIMAEVKGANQDALDSEFSDDAFPTLNPQITDEVKGRYQSIEQFMVDNQLIKSEVDIDGFVDATVFDEA